MTADRCPKCRSILILSFLANGDGDRRALQSEHAADLVFQIPLVGEVEQLLVVAEDDEVGRLHAHLRHVVDLQALALIGRRLYACRCLCQNVVQGAGRNAHRVAGSNLVDEFKQAVKSLAGLRGDKDDRRVGHKGEVLFKLRLIFLHGFVVFFNGVPLIDRNDAALARYRKTHKGSFTLQRYKGLGEMDAQQLWETTLNPETRMLKQVEIEDARMASDVTEMLMGTDVPPRRKFIYDNAKDAELDI